MDRMIQEERLNLWYKAMKNRDIEEADLHKKIIETYPQSFEDLKLRRLFKLFTARHHIMHRELDLAEKVLVEMAPIEQDGDYRFFYYYHFFRGILHYDRKDYKEAIPHFLKAEPIVETIGNPMEFAEFSYKLASVYHRTYHLVLSIEYAQQAFDVFRKHAAYLRTAHCENVIALNYLDMKDYKEAEHHLHNARQYAAKVKDEQIKMIILHNYGSFYSSQNKPKMALIYLSQAYELIKSDTPPLRIQNLFLLAKNYFKTDQTEKARRLLTRATALAKEQNNRSYCYRCDVLKAKYLEPEQLEQAYLAAVEYFNNRETWEYVLTYSEALAIFYKGKEDYQKACKFYDFSIKAKQEMNKARILSQ